MRTYAAIVTMLLGALAMGCVSPAKEMNVTVSVLEESFDVSETGDGLILTVTAEVRVANTGDPGHATIASQVYDELDDPFAEDSEKIHLDTGESKDITIVLEGPVTADADIDAYYNIVKVDATHPD